MKNKKRIIIIVAIVFIAVGILIGIGVKTHKTTERSINNGTVQNELNHIQNVPDGYIGIYTAKDLRNISLNTTANYIVMNDIDMADMGEASFPSVANFTGIFNGNNYEIKNYKSNYPLFLTIYNATIENIHFINAVIDQRKSNDTDTSLGGIIGEDSFKTNNSITNCTFQGEIFACGGSTSTDVGGIIGKCKAETSISNCTFNGDITIEKGRISCVGGIVGYLGEKCSAIYNCYSLGRMIADTVGSLGGICGKSDVDIYNCYSACTLDVTTKAANIGGIVGRIYDGTIKSTYFIGDIRSAADNFGAIAGLVSSDNEIVNQIQYCYYSSEKLNAVGDGKPYANVIRLEMDEMGKKDNFVGFDFNLVWSFGTKDYPYPVLNISTYKFTNFISDTKNIQNYNSLSDVEYAFKQSVLKNSIDEIKPYIYPKAYEILKNSYSKGEENSVLADLNCGIDEFYQNAEYHMGNDVQIKNDYIGLETEEENELTDLILKDIYDVDKTAEIESIIYSAFELNSKTYDGSCMLIIVQTDSGAYLLAIDF